MVVGGEGAVLVGGVLMVEVVEVVGGGYSGGYGGGGGRLNARGFHGEMTTNSRTEQALFNTEITQQTGINFDQYDNIPVEVSN